MWRDGESNTGEFEENQILYHRWNHVLIADRILCVSLKETGDNEFAVYFASFVVVTENMD